MARFKQVPQNFLFRKVLKYFGNMVRNYDGNCRDDDFFAVVRNCFDHDKAVELIEAAYSEKEIEAMAHSRSRNGRLDLSDPLDDVFSALWNNESACGKCRIVLDAVREYMEKDCGSPVGDIVGKRLFFERMFKAKLSDDEFVERRAEGTREPRAGRLPHRPPGAVLPWRRCHERRPRRGPQGGVRPQEGRRPPGSHRLLAVASPWMRDGETTSLRFLYFGARIAMA